MASQANKGYCCAECGGPVRQDEASCPSCGIDRRGAWSVDPFVGRTIARKYRIERRIASGASGPILEATQVHQDVDLGKVVIRMMTRLASEDDLGPASRFMEEARAARTLAGPHALRVFDVDLDAGHVPYLVQEYLDGEPLSRIIERSGRLEPRRAIAIALQVAEGIEEAHGKRILHTSLKPSNVIVLDRQGGDFVKILGMGTSAHGAPPRGAAGRATDSSCIAPEQASGGRVDERTDIFALGVMLHEMLAGAPPGPGGEVSPSLHDISPDLVDLVEMMTEHDPARRPAAIGKVVELIEQVARDQGLNIDITGRITVSEEILDSPRAPAAGAPAVEQEAAPPEVPEPGPTDRAPAGTRVRPAILALAVLGLAIVVAAVGIFLLHRAITDRGQATSPVQEMPPDAPATAVPVAGSEPTPDTAATDAADPPEPDPGPGDVPESGKMTPPRKGSGKKTPWTKL